MTSLEQTSKKLLKALSKKYTISNNDLDVELKFKPLQPRFIMYPRLLFSSSDNDSEEDEVEVVDICTDDESFE